MFRRVPLVYEAEQYAAPIKDHSDGYFPFLDRGALYRLHHHRKSPDVVEIKTKEGWLQVNNGDWVIKGAHGEFWPVANQIFHESYEKDDQHPDLLDTALAAYDAAADKFITKVESGKAHSSETYAALKRARALSKQARAKR